MNLVAEEYYSRIEIAIPDLEPYREGNTGLPYVWRYNSGRAGPHATITALVHGNEPCGAIALDWLLRQDFRPANGSITLIFVNYAAYQSFDPLDATESRYIDEDLNRVWDIDTLDNRNRDSLELRRAREIRPIIDRSDFLLDLHSMQEESSALCLAGALPKGRALAVRMGMPSLIVCDAGHAAGARVRDYGHFSDPSSPAASLLVECGQHWLQPSGTVAIETTVQFLRIIGLAGADFCIDRVPPVSSVSTVVEVTEAVTIQSDMGFTFARDFSGGEIVPEAGTLLGYDGDHPVFTPYDNCFLVMPNRTLCRGQTVVRLGRIVG